MVCGISLRGPCKRQNGLVNVRSKMSMSPSWARVRLLCKGPHLSSSKSPIDVLLQLKPGGLCFVTHRGTVRGGHLHVPVGDWNVYGVRLDQHADGRLWKIRSRSDVPQLFPIYLFAPQTWYPVPGRVAWFT